MAEYEIVPHKESDMAEYEIVPHMNGRDWLVLRRGVTFVTVHQCGHSDASKDAAELLRLLLTGE